jgi:alpha-ribazole phosphatase
MEVYLVRHTKPNQAFSEGICYGQSCIPLASSFKKEASVLLQELTVPIDMVYSSPLNRCLMLAELIKTSSPVIIDKRLLEMNFGAWEMKNWDDIDHGELNNWMNDFVHVNPPGGENMLALNRRVNDFVNELIDKNYKSVVIVTHAGVIRCFICEIKGIPLEDAFKVSVEYGSLTRLYI